MGARGEPCSVTEGARREVPIGPRVAIVLAAGGSTRMGRPKGLLPMPAGGTLVAAHAAVLGRWVGRVIVVVGHRAEAHRAALAGSVAEVVENPDWASTTPADSLRIALRAAPGVALALVTPVDTPVARTGTLAALLAAPAPAVPTGPGGEPGHPVTLGPAEIAAIELRAPPGGLRSLLAQATRVPVADTWVHRDFDDPASWISYLGREDVGREDG